MPSSLSIRRAWYEGGHPARRRPMAGRLRVREDGLSVRSWHGSVTLPWEMIIAIEVALPDEGQVRDTWARVALLGPAAYAFPKKIKASEVVVSTTDGTFLVMIDRAEPEQVLGRLSPWIARVGRAAS